MFRFQPPARNLQGPARSLKTVVLCGFKGIRFRSAMLESATKSRIQGDKILRFLVEGTASVSHRTSLSLLTSRMSFAALTSLRTRKNTCSTPSTYA
jgi:hypothetical protein